MNSIKEETIKYTREKVILLNEEIIKLDKMKITLHDLKLSLYKAKKAVPIHELAITEKLIYNIRKIDNACKYKRMQKRIALKDMEEEYNKALTKNKYLRMKYKPKNKITSRRFV